MQVRDYQEELIKDVQRAYKEGYQRPCIVLPCGGGKSVIVAEIAKRVNAKNGRVLFLVHRQELVNQIKSTFEWWGCNMDLCHIAMVQTITRRLSKEPKPRLIITDENHHCLAKSYTRVYDHFSDVQCLGVTATPVRLNGGGLGDINDILIEGVNAEWLIENQYLAPYDYYAPPTISTEGIKTSKGDYSTADANKVLDKPKIYGDVIGYYKQLAAGKKAVCYCNSVEHSKSMASAFVSAGVNAVHIDGSTPKQERQQIIEDFRNGKILILCNVDLISEGFDVPTCDVAILLRPTKSLSLYIQQAMRCLRYIEGKRGIIIDHVGNVGRFGLPTQPRSWTLEPKRGSNGNNATTEKCKQCVQCYYTHDPAPICPNCGYIYPVATRTIEEIKQARLEKITGIVVKYNDASDCKTVAELTAYARKKGYKQGWVYRRAKAMKLL